jgi:hypothetical protein
MPGPVYGYTRCPDCGLSVPAAQLEGGSHACNPESIIAHKTLEARRALEHLEQDVAAYLTTERAQKLLAFRRWCFDHGR